jgi:hypothetical protein
MKKQNLYCFLLILLCSIGQNPCAAQQYFNKRYTIGCSANLFTAVLPRNNKYYAIASAIDSVNYIGGSSFLNTSGLKFCVMDSAGNLLSSKLYQRADKKFTYLSLSNNFMTLPDGTFLHCFSVTDTGVAPYNPRNYNAQIAIAQFDSMGNVLVYRQYDRPYCDSTDDTYHVLMDFKPDAYGNWLMLSSKICHGKVVYCLRKLDNSFNEVWVKDFSVNSIHNIPKHLLIEPDGYTMTGGMINSNVMGSFPDYYASLIIKCDTAGTMLWSWQNTFDIANLQYTINDIVRTKDSGYIYCGSGKGAPIYYADGSGHWSGIAVYGYVEKLDSARKSVWQTKLGFVGSFPQQNEQVVIKELTDGSIMVAGTLGKNFTKYGYTFAALTKLDAIDGSIIWQRLYEYHPDTLSGFVYDMRQTADGSFILAGYTNDNVVAPLTAPVQRGWLIKVDSNGCEGGASCNPTAIIPVNPNANYINIYPNPSTSDYELQYEVQNNEPLQLVISDITGRILLQTNLPAQQNSYHINAANWATGVYVYQLSGDGAIIKTGKLIKN